MAKKHKKASKNFLKFLTFLVILIILFLFLGISSFVKLSEQKVKGISTVASNNNGKWFFLINMDIFNDYNKDGKWDKQGYGVKGNEQCLDGEFIVRVKGIEYTVKAGKSNNNKWCNPGYVKIDVSSNPFQCANVSFVKKNEGSWKVTGITYTTGHTVKTVKGKASAVVCPMGFMENTAVGLIDFGLIKNKP